MGNPLVDPPSNSLQPPDPNGAPSLADAWQYNVNAASNFIQQQRAQAAAQGLWNPATGLPTAKGLVTAAQQYSNGLLMGSTAPEGGITAYHGSPYDFEKFDMGKIDTGEGAQSYGHGLYFADSPGVAKAYRNSNDTNGPYTVGGVALPDYLTESLQDTAHSRSARGVLLDNAIQDHTRLARMYDNPPPTSQIDPNDDFWDNSPQQAAYHHSIADALSSVRSGKADLKPPGAMYQVNLNTTPEQLFDWDKPLSQQTPEVQQAINGVAKTAGVTVTPDMQGMDFKPFLSDANNVAALRQAGVNGVRYLDQGSRPSDEGTRNYVIFDDNLINIVKKYGVGGLGLGLGAAATQGQPDSQAPAQQPAS